MSIFDADRKKREMVERNRKWKIWCSVVTEVRMAKVKEKSIEEGSVASWRIDSHGAYGDTKESGKRTKNKKVALR